MKVKDVQGKAGGLAGEFRQFIARGNVMDMAVGVIVGGAFKAIADSLTADIIMPIIGIFVSESSFADLFFYINGATITYGNFLQAVLNFFIMAAVVFVMVKAINSLHRKKDTAPSAPPAPSNEEVLLTEIRDLLKENRG